MIISLALLPTIFLKEMAELHWVSMTLFGSALLFIVIFSAQCILRNNHETNPVYAVTPNDYNIQSTAYNLWQFKYNGPSDIPQVITAVCIIFTNINFQNNLFPIHSNQVDKSIKSSAKIYAISLTIVPAVYIIVSVVSIFRYGQMTNASILDNIGELYPYYDFKLNAKTQKYEMKSQQGTKLYYESYVMEFLFLIIIACHIPYIFFSGKEAMLIMIDELMRRSVSLVLSKKMLQDPKSFVEVGNINEDPYAMDTLDFEIEEKLDTQRERAKSVDLQS